MRPPATREERQALALAARAVDRAAVARPEPEYDDEPRAAHPALADREPWSGGFAANH